MARIKADSEKGKDPVFDAPDCSSQTHSEDGVDLTLIRWMLSMTPKQRLETLQNNVWSIMRLRNGVIQT